MKFAIVQTSVVSPDSEVLSAPSTWHSQIKPWLLSWEMYIIVAVASFLRLYQINTTEFDADQANIFHMAYYAVHHGMLVATSNQSSLGTMNPPAIIYMLMPPALFSADPLWAAVWVSLLSIIAVLLTYLFVRRYYGRWTGAIAASFFAVTSLPVLYSRFIWNQNLLLFFVPLFIMSLLWGVVGRKKGWLFPSLFLLGLMYQLHGSSLLLAAALLVAVILSPGTLRWRDLVFAGLALFIIYAPYLLWERYVKFADIFALVGASKQPAQFDNQAISFYQMYLGGNYSWSPSKYPAYFPFWPLNLANNTIVALLIAAGVMALVLVIWSFTQGKRGMGYASSGLWGHLRGWWRNLRADSYRSSLLILLFWQIPPLIYLSHHSVTLYMHYFIFLMPGQYIFIALLLARGVEWLKQFNGWKQLGYIAICIFMALIIAVQLVATAGQITGLANGRIGDGYQPGASYHNNLDSLQNALAEAEQLVKNHHLKHLYVSMAAEYNDLQPMAYLVEHTHVPTTLSNDQCLVLPDSTSGPAALLVGPYNTLTNIPLSQFASATLISKPAHTGGEPFKLYIVNTPVVHAAMQASFPQEMQLLDTQQFNSQNTPWVATRWNILHSLSAEDQTMYSYTLSNLPPNPGSASIGGNRQCLFTSLQAGDQLLATFPLSNGSQKLNALNLQIQATTITLQTLHLHLFRLLNIPFETGLVDYSPATTFQTSNGKDNLAIPLSNQKRE